MSCTGKSTTVKELVKIFQENFPDKKHPTKKNELVAALVRHGIVDWCDHVKINSNFDLENILKDIDVDNEHMKDWMRTGLLNKWINYLTKNDTVVEKDTCLSRSEHIGEGKGFNNLFNGAVVLFGPYHQKRPNEALIPAHLKQETGQCKKRMMVVRLSMWGFNPNNPGIGHANVIIIDNKKKTVERFEPHGYMQRYNTIPNQFLEKKFVPKYFPKYKFMRPLSFEPKLGPQSKQDDSNSDFGFCSIFSTMYTHLRLEDPDKPQRQVVALMSKGTPQDVDERVKLYFQYVHEHLH